ncbi:hypothetical protein K439DRAFT_1617527 [Ramaria rubella]|nr:hypothetical protein K439DRAFT_1617527 [Ramaria rubella]
MQQIQAEPSRLSQIERCISACISACISISLIFGSFIPTSPYPENEQRFSRGCLCIHACAFIVKRWACPPTPHVVGACNRNHARVISTISCNPCAAAANGSRFPTELRSQPSLPALPSAVSPRLSSDPPRSGVALRSALSQQRHVRSELVRLGIVRCDVRRRVAPRRRDAVHPRITVCLPTPGLWPSINPRSSAATAIQHTSAHSRPRVTRVLEYFSPLGSLGCPPLRAKLSANGISMSRISIHVLPIA